MGHQSESKPSPILTWSDLCPDLLLSVFELLSFTNHKRAKLVCRSWNFALRSCVPKRNQIPWLILFPQKRRTNNNNDNSCVLFVPEDKDNLYKTRDLGAEFTKSCCLASYGSWLLMLDHFQNLYIINPLTLERIDLPHHSSLSKKDFIRKACLWVDQITKNYLVIWILHGRMAYTRKGDGRWRTTINCEMSEQIIYNCKDYKVYMTSPYSSRVFVWDFSDDIPKQNDNLLPMNINRKTIFSEAVDWDKKLYYKTEIATAVSGQLLLVAWVVQHSKWQFRIYKYDPKTWRNWEPVDSLGDEALILDMGFTVVAKDVPGLKRNSIYLSSIDHLRKDADHIFVYDLGNRTTERLLQCPVSSLGFSDARWFFPDITH